MLADFVPASDGPAAGSLHGFRRASHRLQDNSQGTKFVLDFPMFFSSPSQAGIQTVVRPGLGDIFAGQETEAAHKSEAVLVFVGGQSRTANSNAYRGQQRERAPHIQ